MGLLIILIVFLLWTCLLLYVITSAFIGFLITRVPFVPTSSWDIEFLVKKLPITSKDTFFDLGSGDGKVVFLVERLSGARVRGYELTSWTHYLALFKKRLSGSKAEFKKEDFFKASWKEATIVYCYLYPPLMAQVEQKARQDLRPGSFVVCRDFYLPGMKPQEVWNMPHDHEIYIYRF
jgi:hypothetical protein